jgi:hypothetical protein
MIKLHPYKHSTGPSFAKTRPNVDRRRWLGRDVDRRCGRAGAVAGEAASGGGGVGGGGAVAARTRLVGDELDVVGG